MLMSLNGVHLERLFDHLRMKVGVATIPPLGLESVVQSQISQL